MLFDDKTKGIAQAYLTMLEANKKKALDPVGKEDGDVDNDGDKDSSDEYLLKRRAAISKSVKEAKCTICNCDKCKCVEEAACGSSKPMKAKKEAIEISVGGKSEVSKKGMKDKDGGDEEEESDDDNDDDNEVEIKTKKTSNDDGKKKKEMPAFMKKEGFVSAAQRKAVWASKNEKGVKEELKGNQHKLDKNKNGKLDKQDFKMLQKESVWNWDEIVEASDEDIDALIETLEGDDLESFMSEFNELTEMYAKATPGVKKDGQEKLEPRAPAEKAFVNAHKNVTKDHPFNKNQHDQGVKSQSKVRLGDKRANEPMKTLKDIRK